MHHKVTPRSSRSKCEIGHVMPKGQTFHNVSVRREAHRPTAEDNECPGHGRSSCCRGGSLPYEVAKKS